MTLIAPNVQLRARLGETAEKVGKGDRHDGAIIPNSESRVLSSKMLH